MAVAVAVYERKEKIEVEDKKVNAPVTFRADEETRKLFEETSVGFKNKNVFVQTLLDIYKKSKELAYQAEEAISLKIENETLKNQNETLKNQLEELRREYDGFKIQTDVEKQLAEIQKQAEIAKAVADESAKGLERLNLLQETIMKNTFYHNSSSLKGEDENV